MVTQAEALNAARQLGYPVVVKAVGPKLVHKTRAACGRRQPAGCRRVGTAWADFETRLGGAMTGALVQEMVSGGIEMLVGMVEDATFGPVLACAFGGTLTEILADSQFRLHPLTDRDARSMVSELRGAKLLSGFRGAPPVDVAALEDTLSRLSVLVDLAPEIRELDVNPLMVLPTGVRALDTRIRIGRPASRPRARRVSY